MASRDVLDNRLDVFKDAAKDGQDTGRGLGTWGPNYGQVLRGNGRPSDQPNDGPQMPANLRNDAWIDVYDAPNGFGWALTAEADEAGTLYRKTIFSHEGGPLVESNWALVPNEVLP